MIYGGARPSAETLSTPAENTDAYRDCEPGASRAIRPLKLTTLCRDRSARLDIPVITEMLPQGEWPAATLTALSNPPPPNCRIRGGFNPFFLKSWSISPQPMPLIRRARSGYDCGNQDAVRFDVHFF